MLLNNIMDFDQWLTDTVTERSAANGMAAIDKALISDIAGLFAVNEEDVALTVRCLLDAQAVPTPAYEIRTDAWRVDLLPATAKAVVSGTLSVLVLQHIGVDYLPVAILAAVAALLFSIHRVEVTPAELALHARLLDAVTASPHELEDLYQTLPKDIRGELTIGELADVIERFHQAGLARWENDGVTMLNLERRRKFRLVTREPDVGALAGQLRAARGPDVSRKVFVIHGRDEQARRTMFGFLRALDLLPQEWEPLVAATGSTLPNLNEVVATGLSAGQAQAVLAILTPDDIVTLHPALRATSDPEDETSQVMQPRPNVLIELGMALSAYPSQTIVVEIGSIRRIADLAGFNVIHFDGSTSLSNALGKVVERLKTAGCAVNDKGSDWRDVREFRELSAYHRKPETATES